MTSHNARIANESPDLVGAVRAGRRPACSSAGSGSATARPRTWNCAATTPPLATPSTPNSTLSRSRPGSGRPLSSFSRCRRRRHRKTDYLLRPDRGRRLDDAARAEVSSPLLARRRSASRHRRRSVGHGRGRPGAGPAAAAGRRRRGPRLVVRAVRSSFAIAASAF